MPRVTATGSLRPPTNEAWLAVQGRWDAGAGIGPLAVWMPRRGSTRAGYLAAVMAAGCHICDVIDVPMQAVPAVFFSDPMLREVGDKPFGLIVLAQKPAREPVN